METRGMRRATTILGAAAILAFASATQAQPNDPALAETLFEEGTKLFDAGHFAEACPKFAAAHKADPGYGAVFNLAACHESLGKTASAWAAFLEAVAVAKNPAEAADAKQHADAIAAKLVRLQISVLRPTENLVIKRDGSVLDRAAWGTPVPVDPGNYRLDAEAPGKKAWSAIVQAQGEGKTISIEVPVLEDAPAAAPTSTPTIVDPPRAIGAHQKLAITAGGVGVAGVVIGSALALVAKSKWDDAKPHCDDQHSCDPFGLTTGNSAHDLANAATAGFAIGGAGLAAGVILWLTAPPARTSTAPAPLAAEAQPWFSHDGGGIRVRGQF